MKFNAIVVLIVGLVIGFAVGKVVSGPSSPSSSSATASRANAPTQGQQQPRAVNPETMPLYKVEIGDSLASGRDDSILTLVEFSDYQCPYCIRAAKTVKQLEDEYGDKLRVVMKHNPLPNHPLARPAAVAALAAGEQGKFWQFHDELFERAPNIGEDVLVDIAEDVGLDMAKWNESRKSPKHLQQIQKDQAQAQKLGATGTPAFFLNGRFLSGAQPIETFRAVAEYELKRAEALIAAGTPRAQVYAKAIEKGNVGRPPPPPPPAEYSEATFTDESPSFGPKNAKVTIVEYSDFQCPYCARGAKTVSQIKEEFPDVRVVFRHKPLPNHPQAPLAAEASMAAHEQGKFWEFHDKVFANQSSLNRETFERYAKELGLDLNKFKAALDGGKYKAFVQRDSQAADQVGVSGTPGFFVNGRLIPGAYPIETFRTVIASERERAEKLLAQGVKPADLYARLLADAPKPKPAEFDLSDAPFKGAQNAAITVVEFSDFQCPYCARAVNTVNQIAERYQGKVKVAFKHLPLDSIHPNARPAAEAAMAAAAQGKFWEYHDKLFQNQRQLDAASLEKYAEELGLDMAKFKASLASKKPAQQVQADYAEAMQNGVNSTPSFFVNGFAVKGGDVFGAIERELAKASKQPVPAKAAK